MDDWKLFENEAIRFFQNVLDCKDAQSRHVAGYQIDCWAETNDFVFVVECKNTEQLDPSMVVRRDYRKDILQFAAKKTSLGKHIESLPRTKKPVWIFCTNGSIPTEANYELAKEHGLSIWTSGHLELLKKLKKSLGNQLVWQVIKEAGYDAERIDAAGYPNFKYPALPRKAMFGGEEVDVYTFYMPAKDLLPLSYVYRIREDETESYQRLLDPKKVKSIGEFIDSGNTINSSILVNLPRTARFVGQKNAEHFDSSFGFLSIPKIRNSIRLIDGQHRLYGFVHASTQDQQIPVIALLGASGSQEAQAFIDINEHQKKVPMNDLLVILARTDPDNAGFLPDLIMRMNNGGLFKGRIQMAGLRMPSFSAGKQRLSLATMNTVLRVNGFVDTSNKRRGVINTDEYESKEYAKKEAKVLLEHFFSRISEVSGRFSQEWVDDFVMTNPGFQILLPVLRQMSKYDDTGNLKSVINELTNHLSGYFEKNVANITDMRQASGAAGRSKYSYELIAAINEKEPGFAPTFLKSYRSSQLMQDTQSYPASEPGRIQIAHDVEKELKEFLISFFGEKFGDDWFDNQKIVDDAIRKKANGYKAAQAKSYYEIGSKSPNRHEVFYLPMGDVLKLIRMNKPSFLEIIPMGFTQFEADLDLVRNVGDKRHEGSSAEISPNLSNLFDEAVSRLRPLLNGS